MTNEQMRGVKISVDGRTGIIEWAEDAGDSRVVILIEFTDGKGDKFGVLTCPRDRINTVQ